MIAWWDALSQVERFFAIIAIPSTLLLFVQTILLIFGMTGHSGDAEHDVHGGDTHDFHDHHIDLHHDGDAYEAHIEDGHGEHVESVHEAPDAGLRLFTVRGFVAFFSVFGWTGLAMLRGGIAPGISIGTGVIGGLAAMVGIALIFKLFLKLQQDGTADISYALGRSGTVYLTVPASRASKGKITVIVGDQLMELDAVTDNATAIKTGEEITVVGFSGSNTLVVRPK